MSKKERVWKGDPDLCPHCHAQVRVSKFKWRSECDLSRKPQECCDTGLCTQWQKVR